MFERVSPWGHFPFHTIGCIQALDIATQPCSLQSSLSRTVEPSYKKKKKKVVESKSHDVLSEFTILWWATNHDDSLPHVAYEMQVGHASLHYIEFSSLNPVCRENFHLLHSTDHFSEVNFLVCSP